MAYNRELSQFASLVEVNNTSKRIGVSTDISISGIVTANYFYGDGRYLTNIIASFVPSGATQSVQINNGGYPAGASEFFYNVVSNNVGIATSTPTSKLHVNGNSLFIGISTFTNGPVIIGSGTSTGTATQRLQVTGKSYFTDSLGIGITNPTNRVVIGGETVQYPQSLQVLSTLHSSSRRAGVSFGGTTGNQTPDWQLILDVSGNGIKDLGFYSTNNNNIPLRFDTTGNTIVQYYPLLIGAASSTGTRAQPLQVAGGAYIRDNLGINFPSPTSRLYVQGDAYFIGIITSTNYSASNSYQINNVPVITSGRGIANITSGVIVGINSNGTYVGAGVTTLDFVGTGASVRLNITTNRVEVALRDEGITGSYVEDAQDLFGWIPKTVTTNRNIVISTDNAGSSNSYVMSNISNIVIGNGFSLSIDSGKTVVINPLSLYG
jgi:hypothetical protein